MTLKRMLLGCFLLPVSPLAAAELYRCEQEGQLLFTDQPCHADAEPLLVQGPNRIQPGRNAELLKQHDERLQRERSERDQADARWLEAHEKAKEEEERMQRALADNRVIKGMTPAQVRQVWGEPTEIEHTEKGERWIYKENRKRRTVSFVDERVSAVSGSGPGR